MNEIPLRFAHWNDMNDLGKYCRRDGNPALLSVQVKWTMLLHNL